MAEDLERKILVVDDNPNHRNMVIGVLDNLGYNPANGYPIEEASDGSIAVERARGVKYHLITMDWQMDKMNGLDAIEHIREFDKDTPIVMISTGHDDLGVTRLGATAYVRKEYVEQELPNVLKQIFNTNT